MEVTRWKDCGKRSWWITVEARYRHHIGHLDLPFSASPPNATKINRQMSGRSLLPEVSTVSGTWSQEDDDPDLAMGLGEELGMKMRRGRQE